MHCGLYVQISRALEISFTALKHLELFHLWNVSLWQTREHCKCLIKKRIDEELAYLIWNPCFSGPAGAAGLFSSQTHPKALCPRWTTAWSGPDAWPESPPAPVAAGCPSPSEYGSRRWFRILKPNRPLENGGRSHLVCKQQVTHRWVLGILHDGCDDLQHRSDS